MARFRLALAALLIALASRAEQFHGAAAFSEASSAGRAIHEMWVNAPTAQKAEEEALALCRKVGGSDCKVVLRFQNSCGAIALGAAGKRVGSGLGPKVQDAHRLALQSCEKAGGKSCRVVQAACSTGVVENDGCARSNEWCVCGNTKRAGKCGTGSDKAGLYCHCDQPMTHHDGCAGEGQACHCGGESGPSGSCNLGSLKAGLYCQCG